MTDVPDDDPYRVLGVSRAVTPEELRRAYEQRLASAAAAEAWRTAQKIDAAFSLLRDPHRRAVFDREGRIVDIPRVALQESCAPTATPSTRRPPTARDYREGARNLLVAVVVAAMLAAGLKFGLFRGADGRPLTSDVWHSAVTTSAPPIPIQHALHRERLLPPVAAPAGSGPHRFEIAVAGVPVRWDPCAPIRYVISGNSPFPRATEMLSSAIGEVSAATGLQFVYAGQTSEQPSEHRSPYQPGRYGKRWAPVLVAWTDPRTVPGLAGNVVGLGGGTAVTVDGQPRVVSGVVLLDGPEMAAGLSRRDGPVETRAVVLHEFGHLVGLAHVHDPSEIMNPTAVPLPHYAAGDLQGLAILGNGPCPTGF